MQRIELTHYLADLLNVNRISDYCPNGLQVEGRDEVQRIVTGVTASQALIEKAIELNADALLVHHGYFWKGEDAAITGMKKHRIAALLKHDINLYAYHLPLDVHPEFGNNAQLAKRCGWPSPRALAEISPEGVVMMAEWPQPRAFTDVLHELETTLARQATVSLSTKALIQRVAWCTGGGQNFIDAAFQAGADCFISGEISEQTTHSAREHPISYIAAGHHATERFGIEALGQHLAERFDLSHQFIDIENPA